MKDHKFTFASSTEPENAWIDGKIDEFNRSQFSFTGEHLEHPMNYVIKDGNVVLAGIKSCFYLGEVLSISVLFVDENYRKRGLGSELLNKVENEARNKGAKLAHLYAFDQTKNFYIRHGYEVFGVLENCPIRGHGCYYLKKVL